MRRTIIFAAVAAAMMAFVTAAPVQARMTNPGLNTVAPTTPLVEDVHYRRYRHTHRYNRHRARHYQGHRYRHCYNHRVRVPIAGGRIVFRTHSRCGWRYR